MISMDSRTPLAQVLAHPNGVLDRLVEGFGPPHVAVGVGSQGGRLQAGESPVNLAALLQISPLGDGLHVDGQVPPFGPPSLFGNHEPAAGHDERKAWPLLGSKQGAHQPTCRVHLLAVRGIFRRPPRCGESSSVLNHELVGRLHRPGCDNGQRRLLDARRREPSHWPIAADAELTGRVPEHAQQLLVGLLGGLGSSCFVEILGVQRGQHRREFAGPLGESRPRRRDVLAVPLLAAIQHELLEGLFTRVSGEEVLADPIFDDDQGVTAWHGHTPHERSGSFPARRRAGAAPTSAAAPYRR